ncbi:MAG: hypothetical protein O7C56_06795 [Rickettsia endosymbiont of Ixodes persulcatus]|nr:hypothetical protein [Rickettsia endosymbiont of Ixodes persulcatus]
MRTKTNTNGLTIANTHPFLLDDQLSAHNGIIKKLKLLNTHLEKINAQGLINEQSDSDQIFTLITAETHRHDKNVNANPIIAMHWITKTLPIFSLNHNCNNPFAAPTHQLQLSNLTQATIISQQPTTK